MVKPAAIQAVFVGQPKEITDMHGIWHSSIYRDRVEGPVQVSLRGLAGDKVAQAYHGSPDAAICVHLTDHYSFWNSEYSMGLEAGCVGENLTLDGVCEDQICVGDRVRLGNALVEVSGPRVPCANLARRIGWTDWVNLTIRENRTGFYLRVLEPGRLEAGDQWVLEERLNPDGAISAINRCMYLEFDVSFARRMLEMHGLGEWWKDQARQKIDDRDGRWTSTMDAERN